MGDWADDWTPQEFDSDGSAVHPWSYFRNAEEANEWLEFDAIGEECDQAAYSDPDRYEEWLSWRRQDRTI